MTPAVAVDDAPLPPTTTEVVPALRLLPSAPGGDEDEELFVVPLLVTICPDEEVLPVNCDVRLIDCEGAGTMEGADAGSEVVAGG